MSITYSKSSRGIIPFAQLSNGQLLVSEALDPDLDFEVLQVIFGADRLPKLQAIDCKLPR